MVTAPLHHCLIKYDRARDNGKCYLFVQYHRLGGVHGVIVILCGDHRVSEFVSFDPRKEKIASC